MIQLKDYEIYDFKEIVIEESGNYCLLKIKDNALGEVAIRYDKVTQRNRIIEVIRMFLEAGNICMVNDRIPIVRSIIDKNCMEIESLDNRKLKMYIYDPKFKSISDLVIGKYINDREMFFKDDDAKEVRLSSGHNKFMYKVDNDCLNITLCTDYNNNIINSEVEFMMRYLYNKFDSLKEEVFVDILNEGTKNEEYVIGCGDFKMSFPRIFTYSPIFSMAKRYSYEVKKKRKR